MAFFRSIACLIASAALIQAVAIPSHHEIHEKRERLHPRWTKLDRVEPHKLFHMRIGLVQSNIETGYEHLYDV